MAQEYRRLLTKHRADLTVVDLDKLLKRYYEHCVNLKAVFLTCEAEKRRIVKTALTDGSMESLLMSLGRVGPDQLSETYALQDLQRKIKLSSQGYEMVREIWYTARVPLTDDQWRILEQYVHLFDTSGDSTRMIIRIDDVRRLTTHNQREGELSELLDRQEKYFPPQDHGGDCQYAPTSRGRLRNA